VTGKKDNLHPKINGKTGTKIQTAQKKSGFRPNARQPLQKRPVSYAPARNGATARPTFFTQPYRPIFKPQKKTTRQTFV
jgi:hypothetical protein